MAVDIAATQVPHITMTLHKYIDGRNLLMIKLEGTSKIVYLPSLSDQPIALLASQENPMKKMDTRSE